MQRIYTLILHLRAHGHIVEHRARLLLRFCAAVGNCSIRQSISKWIQNIFYQYSGRFVLPCCNR